MAGTELHTELSRRPRRRRRGSRFAPSVWKAPPVDLGPARVVIAVSVLTFVLVGCASSQVRSSSADASGGGDPTTVIGNGPDTSLGATDSSVTATVTPVEPTTSTAATTPPASISKLPHLAALAGHTIVIDPGHNGQDSEHPNEINAQVFIGNGSKACESTGTAGNDGYAEHAFTFDVATRVQAILTAAGAHVVMTRPSDDGWGPCIIDRARIGNEAHAELGLSIHGDGAPESGRGFHVIRPLPVPGYNDGIVEPSGRFATMLRDAFAAGTGMPTANYIASAGLISRSDLGGLNMSHLPKVFIECGNMRNATDEAMLHDEAWRQRAAEAIAEAMNTYFASA
jgi:N-acetylmuramoyl-L-alanine amidase